uniref:DUF21 domain-containing protein At2g14520-like n=1 Tax=Rhizophora mucronata TaxID=61149 RepID=A0A2P2LE18_RHIMU
MQLYPSLNWFLFLVLTEKILPVVRNQHLLLCTLLISNAAAMEALPIFLDGLVAAWGAILISVTLILLFGEVRNHFSLAFKIIEVGQLDWPLLTMDKWVCELTCILHYASALLTQFSVRIYLMWDLSSWIMSAFNEIYSVTMQYIIVAF